MEIEVKNLNKKFDNILAVNNLNFKIKKNKTLAGSVITMDKTFKNLINMNFSIQEAVEMTSYNASKYLGIKNIGKIQHGYLSNFLLLDKEFNIIDIYLEGEKINA